MIQTDIDYPAGLPHALREGHESSPMPTFLRTPMESGRSRLRMLFESVPQMAQVAFIFTDNEAAIFEGWYKYTLNNGTQWFNFPRKTPLGQSRLVARFASVYTGPMLFGVNRWRYSAQLEIWEVPVIDRIWVDFADLYLGASIIDLALNREWPEA